MIVDRSPSPSRVSRLQYSSRDFSFSFLYPLALFPTYRANSRSPKQRLHLPKLQVESKPVGKGKTYH